MPRTNRLAILAAAVLLLVAAGSALANRAPAARDLPAAPASSHEPEAEAEGEETPPTADEIASAAQRLEAKGIPFDDAALSDLAARYGIGGAIRVLAWSQEAQTDVATITDMRDGTETEPGMGWGRIAKALDVHPGLGKIMGNGHGRDDAPGQLKQAPEE